VIPDDLIPRKPLWNGLHVVQTNSRSVLITREPPRQANQLLPSLEASPINLCRLLSTNAYVFPKAADFQGKRKKLDTRNIAV
jgi:hypothetical protein